MNRQNRNPFVGIAAAIALTLLIAGGCASKKYVADGLTSQEAKLSEIESQVEKNQRDLRATGMEVDEAARTADAALSASEGAGKRADEAYRLAGGKLLYKVILADLAGNFAFESDALSAEARSSLDDLATRLKKDNAGVYLEIEGHTDSSGPEAHNMQLGLRRAEAVRRYLNSEHGIPLHRMSVISFGESRPAADNGTREGRATNRRVEIRVLS
jgi:outer membrane protein OmpA-like peptidoglycan-associated protein